MIREKYTQLSTILLQYPQALLAFSGGVDSSLLLAAWTRIHLEQATPGARLLAITFDSPLLPSGELDAARKVFSTVEGWRSTGLLSSTEKRAITNGDCEEKLIKNRCVSMLEHRIIEMNPLTEPSLSSVFSQNPTDRCYHCKSFLFNHLLQLAEQEGIPVLLDGANSDDEQDYRPGQEAARQLGVVSPLAQARMGKQEIRRLSFEWGLPGYDRPSMACLASRIPFGAAVSHQKLTAIDQSEVILLERGFLPVRVRAHGNLARIEVGSQGVPAERLLQSPLKEEVQEALKSVGFQYITIDLSGYQTGSLNPKS